MSQQHQHLKPSRLLATVVLLGALIFLRTTPLSAVDEGSQEGHTKVVLCTKCHEEMRELMARPVSHEPAREGNCTSCHSPHAARYPHMLNKRVRALCSSCHKDAILGFMTGGVHQPVRQGECDKCHDAHGSDHEGLLRAAGNELCFGCHADKKSALESPTRHAPFVDGDCSDCHRPHNSPHAGLLTSEAGSLCAECHDAADEAFSEAHHQIPVAGSACIECHEPHASAGPKLFRKVAHQPFADGECGECHLLDSGTPRLVKATGGALCLNCHDGYPRSDDTVAHAPVKEGNCSACHNPHASDRASLLVSDSRSICIRCHTEVEKRFASSRTSHPRSVQGGSCMICHAAHSSKEPALLKAGAIRTCLPCHEMQRHGHPLGADRIDPRTGQGITCVTCHDPHGTDFPYQLRGDQSRGLCLECHPPEGTPPNAKSNG
ncbi:MAG: cytochrome c3 family protein [Planctomycetota bacterium]